MSFKLHQIRCNFPEISYLSETQKNEFQFLNKTHIMILVCAADDFRKFRKIRKNYHFFKKIIKNLS